MAEKSLKFRSILVSSCSGFRSLSIVSLRNQCQCQTRAFVEVGQLTLHNFETGGVLHHKESEMKDLLSFCT